MLNLKYNKKPATNFWATPEGIYNEAKRRAFSQAQTAVDSLRACGITTEQVTDETFVLALIDTKEREIIANIAERQNKQAEAQVDPFSYTARRTVPVQTPTVEAPTAPIQNEVVVPAPFVVQGPTA